MTPRRKKWYDPFMGAADVPPHRLKVVLVRPQIAPNTGNVARLCVAAGAELHLVRPLGFVLSDRTLRRSAMDYWPRLRLTVHDDEAAFLAAAGKGDPSAGETGGAEPGVAHSAAPNVAPDVAPRAVIWLFSSKAQRRHWDADFADGDWLVFGSETHGLPDRLLERFPDRCLRIPQSPGERCLNLSTAAGVSLYEALRRLRGRVAD